MLNIISVQNIISHISDHQMSSLNEFVILQMANKYYRDECKLSTD